MKDLILTTLRFSIFLSVFPFTIFAQNNALQFDDVDDYISFVSGPSFSGSGTMTFEAWINASIVTGSQTIASWTDGGSNEARFAIVNGFLDLFESDGVQSGSVTGSIAINANEWTHVAFVETSGSIDFYVNGVQEIEGFNVASAGLSSTFALGSYNTSFNPYGGLMDEVRVWSSAQSQFMIQSYMFKSLAGDESNLIAYYQFNETTGTSLPDLTTSSFDGVLNNFPGVTDPNWQESGASPKNALDFDGVDDYVDISAISPNVIGGEGNFSVELWVNLEPVFTGSRRGSIFSVNDGGGANLNRVLLYVHDGTNSNLENRIGVVDAGINPDFDIFGPVIADNFWHHVAYTRTGSTGTLYVDGLEIGTHSADFSFQSGDLWSLGQEFDGSATMSDFIDGQLDDVRIWSVARSQAEIQADMFNDLVGDEANLIAYYDFNQGFADGTNTSFNTLIDRTTNGYDGSLGAFALSGTSSNWVASTSQVPVPEITIYAGDDNTGTELFDGQVTPVNFGSVLSGSTMSLTFAIENVGFEDLNVTDISVGGEFSVTSGSTLTIAPGNTANFTIELDATTSGISNDFITITNDDPNETSVVIPITGTRGILSPKLWWTDDTSNLEDEIGRSNLDGTSSQIAYYTGFSTDIRGIALDQRNNMIFWTNTDAEIACGRIGESGFVATGGPIVDEGGGSPKDFLGIDVDGFDSKIYWCDAENGQIRRVNFDGTDKEVLVNIGSPRDIILAPNEMYYLANNAGTPEIWKADKSGSGQENIISSTGTTFRGLALDILNSHLYWTEDGNINRADLDGSNVTTMSTQVADPEAIQVDPLNEMIYVVDGANNQIVRISYANDPLEVVQSSAGLADPQYLALDTRTFEPLMVVSSDPQSNATGVNLDANITITFNQIVHPLTANSSNVLVIGEQTGEISGSLTGGVTNTIVFDPTNDFKAGEKIHVSLTSSIASLDGQEIFYTGGSLSNGHFLGFTTYSDPAPNVPPLLQESTVYNDGTNTGVDRVVAIDVNQDGSMDVVSIYEGIDDGVAWYQNDGAEQFTRNVAAIPAMSFAETVGAADLDLDGDIDLLGAYNGRLDWYNNDGAFNFTETFIYQVGVGFGVQEIEVVDFDSDGDLDIVGVFVSMLTHYFRWFENDGNSNFTNNIIYGTTTDFPNGLEVADVDGDGDSDVLASWDGGISWFENDGNQNFTAHPITPTSLTSQFSGFTTGDFNGDGHLDMAQNTTTEIAWFANDGLGNFTENIFFGGGNDLHATDLDGDGDLDLIEGSGDLRFQENDGSGNFISRITPTATNIEDVFITDLDSDGDLDVVVGGQGSRVVWFENTIITEPEIAVYIGSDNTGTLITDGQTTDVDIGSAVETNDITQTFAIENTGDASLIISSIASSITEYTVSGVPATVEIGATETFSITLNGMNAGTFSATITINNNDSNENPFTFPVTGEITSSNQPPVLSYVFYLDESSPDGTVVGAVVATDPENDPLTYSILSGNANNAFAIGSTTGELTVNSSAALNFETTPVFNLVVQADDGNGGISMVSITINILETPLGIGNLEKQVKIYPNPVDDIMFIELDGISSRDLVVKLYTVSGSQVLNDKMILQKSNTTIEIKLEDLTVGMYLLKLTNGTEGFTKNILVK